MQRASTSKAAVLGVPAAAPHGGASPPPGRRVPAHRRPVCRPPLQAGDIEVGRESQFKLRKGVSRRGSALGTIDLEEDSDKPVREQLKEVRPQYRGTAARPPDSAPLAPRPAARPPARRDRFG